MTPPEIKWLGHASFKIKADKVVIYIDPYNIKKSPEHADIILITHSHFDHCSLEDVAKLTKPGTAIVGPADCASKFKGSTFQKVAPNEKLNQKGITIETVPAYNTNKDFHPRTNNWVGYIVDVGGFRIYHAGDTDLIPEMDNLKVDVALLPVGGTYTMTAEEAAEAVSRIKPKKAIPMHYNSIVGTLKDAEEFKRLAAPVEVEILNPQ